MNAWLRLLAALLPLAGAARAQPAEPPTLRPAHVTDLPGWMDDRHAETLPPLLAGCRALAAWPADRPLGGAGVAKDHAGTPAAWRHLCTEAAALADHLRPPARRRPLSRAAEARAARERDEAVRVFLERHLQVFAAGGGLLTGYYEPQLRGADFPHAPHLVPLHALPDAARPRPLPDRAAIEGGALDGQGLELAWVDDPVDAFFLQIQGSGRVVLADGRTLRLGYAAQNGHPYYAIGRGLIEMGHIAREQMSMQAIRAWLLRAEPGEAAALLRRNASYVFFRVVEGLRPEEGPIGALGAPLSPARSLAVDPAFIPFGAPVFVATKDPLTGQPWRRLLLAQDTGGAIRGPARGDVFWGWGAEAAERAGRMRETAEVFVLLPRAVAPSRQTTTPLD